MIQILQLPGTDKQLYKLVAPLVMDPKVLKQNFNFPFRTGENFTWFLALDGKTVMGFIPVENKASGHLINNYYIKNKDCEVLKSLLEEVIAAWNDERPLAALCFMNDREVFENEGFKVERVWTRYVKMWKDKK